MYALQENYYRWKKIYKNSFSATYFSSRKLQCFGSVLQGNKWAMCCSACSSLICILPNTEAFWRKSKAPYFFLWSVHLSRRVFFFFSEDFLKFAKLCAAIVPVCGRSCEVFLLEGKTYPVAMEVAVSTYFLKNIYLTQLNSKKILEHPFINSVNLVTMPTSHLHANSAFFLFFGIFAFRYSSI